jgi:hypothetical protein
LADWTAVSFTRSVLRGAVSLSWRQWDHSPVPLPAQARASLAGRPVCHDLKSKRLSFEGGHYTCLTFLHSLPYCFLYFIPSFSYLLFICCGGSWCRCRHVFGRYSTRISADIPSTLAEVIRGFPQFLQANSGIVSRLGPWPLSSRSFPIHDP